jgi:hypothetical protein
MQRTIRDGDWDYVNPAIFTFTDSARREIERLRAAFPGKRVSINWAKAIRVHGTGETLSDRIVVGLGTPEENEPAFVANLDGHEIEIAIPAEVTRSEAPVIGTNADGRLALQD